MIVYNAAEFSDYVIDNEINLVLNFCLIFWNILRQAFLLLSIKSGPFFSVFFLKNITPPPPPHTHTHHVFSAVWSMAFWRNLKYVAINSEPAM